MPAQLKPLPVPGAKPTPEPARRNRARVARQCRGAHRTDAPRATSMRFRCGPAPDGALYQVYAARGPRDRDCAPARRGAGDGGRWRYRALDRGRHVQRQRRCAARQCAGQADRSGLKTNLVITTSRRTYLLELTSTEKAWMASASWDYPKDQMLALQRQAQAASAAAPVDTGLSLEKIRFRYAVCGSDPPWKPLRAFDDGEKVYIQFPPGYRARRAAAAVRDRRAGQRATGELPFPLAVLHRRIGCSARPNCAWAVTRATWCGSSARTAWRGGTDHEPGRRSDLATPQAGEVAPEAVALRAQPRPVTRLNRRTLAILVGGLSVAVLGAMIWSMQPQRRGARRAARALQRRSCLEVRRAGWRYRRTTRSYPPLPPQCAGARAAVAGRPWPGHRRMSQQPVTPAYAPPRP